MAVNLGDGQASVLLSSLFSPLIAPSLIDLHTHTKFGELYPC